MDFILEVKLPANTRPMLCKKMVFPMILFLDKLNLHLNLTLTKNK